MLCSRVQGEVFKNLCPDQAAYRPGFSVDDHLLTVTLLVERCKEFNQDLFVGLVDFEKAFDTIEHPMLWKALREVGVEDSHIEILQKLYDGQVAAVVAGAVSRDFSLMRGVKQGDPISGLLFISVLEVCFRKLKKKWAQLNEKRSGSFFGMVVDDESESLTNLRFADDVLLVASSISDAKKMLTHLASAAAEYGLKLNASKTVVLALTSKTLPASIIVGSNSVGVLGRTGCSKYLGRNLCLEDLHQAELSNRLRCAWAAFSKYGSIFKSRAYSFSLKARLLEAVVTPVALYGCSSWTLTSKMESQLRTTKRRMLRTMSCFRRRPEETWVEHIQRTTVEVESRMANLNFNCWVLAYRRLKWRFVAKTVKMTDGRWSRRLLDWQPHFRCAPCRSVGRPLIRWHDCFIKMVGGDWQSVAQSDSWSLLEDGFMHDLA